METGRLLLRRYQPEDLEDYFAYISDPEVARYEPYRPMSREEAERDLEGRISSDEFVALEERASHRLIGNLYVGRREFSSLELGYVLGRPFWGKGYGSEACAAAIQAAFSQGIHRIYAECDPANERSWRLLERLGFSREGYLRQNVYFWTDEEDRPLWKDTFLYGLLAGEGPSGGQI